MSKNILLLALVFSPALPATLGEPGKEEPIFEHRDQLKDRLGLRTVFWVCSDKSKLRKIYCEDMGIHETEGPKPNLPSSSSRIGTDIPMA